MQRSAKDGKWYVELLYLCITELEKGPNLEKM